MCKKIFYTFLHFKIFNLNQLSKNKIEPIEPKLDFSMKIVKKNKNGLTPLNESKPFFKIFLEMTSKKKIIGSANYFYFTLGTPYLIYS